MIRRVLLCSGAVLIGAAVVCAGVAGAGVVGLLLAAPPADEGVRRVAQLRPWGLALFGCALAGFVALWFVRDRGREAAAEPSDTEGRPRE